MRIRNAAGFTLIELLIVSGVIGTLAAIAIPGLLRSRMSANEASTISSLRTINSANVSFMLNCTGGMGYANNLGVLGSQPDNGGQAFISPDLGVNAPITRSSYEFTYASVGDEVPASTCVSAVSTASPAYFVAAAPLAVGQSGAHYYATSEAQAIFEDIVPITAIAHNGTPTPATATPVK